MTPFAKGDGQRLFAVCLVLALLLLGSTPPVIFAADYDGTNPALTPCGDGSHAIETARRFFLRKSGLAAAQVLGNHLPCAVRSRSEPTQTMMAYSRP